MSTPDPAGTPGNTATTQAIQQAAGQPPKHEPSALLKSLLDKPLERMSEADFKSLAEKDASTAGRLGYALLRMNTAELPNTVFVKRDGVYLKKVKCRAQLKVGQHLTSWNAKGEDDDGSPKKVYSINAAGFRHLNQYVGLQVITPPEVVVNDQRQPNPYIEVDEVTKLPARVYCRKLAMGPSQATGALVATDMMIRLDLNIYLVEMILAKLKWNNQEDRAWGRVGAGEDKPADVAGVSNAWRFLPILSIGGLGVWINAAHPKMLRFLSEHMTRTKFIDRIVQTMAERNALKAHPSMPGTVNQVVNDIATFEVVGWTRDWSRDEMEEIEQLAMNGRLSDLAESVISGEITETEVLEEDGEGALVTEAVNEQAETERVEGPKTKSEREEESAAAQVDVAQLTADAVRLFGDYKRRHGVKAKEKLKLIIGDKKLEEADPAELQKIIEEFSKKGA